MARGATFELIGVPAFVGALDALRAEVRVQLGRAAGDTARRVATRARSLAPQRTGTLASAINFDGKDLHWRAGVEDRSYPSRGGNTAHQNPWVYGVWYELGFVTRKIARHAFMGPAADAELPAYEQRCADAVNQAIS